MGRSQAQCQLNIEIVENAQMLYDAWRYKLQASYHIPLPPFSLLYGNVEYYLTGRKKSSSSNSNSNSNLSLTDVHVISNEGIEVPMKEVRQGEEQEEEEEENLSLEPSTISSTSKQGMITAKDGP